MSSACCINIFLFLQDHNHDVRKPCLPRKQFTKLHPLLAMRLNCKNKTNCQQTGAKLMKQDNSAIAQCTPSVDTGWWLTFPNLSITCTVDWAGQAKQPAATCRNTTSLSRPTSSCRCTPRAANAQIQHMRERSYIM